MTQDDHQEDVAEYVAALKAEVARLRRAVQIGEARLVEARREAWGSIERSYGGQIDHFD